MKVFTRENLWPTEYECIRVEKVYGRSNMKVFTREGLWPTEYECIREEKVYSRRNVKLFEYTDYNLRLQNTCVYI